MRKLSGGDERRREGVSVRSSTTSGSAVMICSFGSKSARSLYLRSPIALHRPPTATHTRERLTRKRVRVGDVVFQIARIP